MNLPGTTKSAIFSTGFLIATLVSISYLNADPPEKRKNIYFLDPKPIGKTPKYLGVNTEVMHYADSSNIWDWLADAGVGMVRVGVPDQSVRKETSQNKTDFSRIQTRRDFEQYCQSIANDPLKKIPWNNYLFSEEIPWIGTPDKIMNKLQSTGIKPILSMACHPKYFDQPILRQWYDKPEPPDNYINWAVAASAYEYYFACIYRYANNSKTTHFMMLNEPDPGDTLLMRQVGVLGKIARKAMEDVKVSMKDKKTASALQLSGPAMYMAWEEYFPFVSPYVDFLDIHLYEPDDHIFARKLSRAFIRARLSGKKLALTEFNRVGGPMPPEESLFSVIPSLQAASLIMEVISAAKPVDPKFEMALFYQFQFPATHRNFKSLVYGDMNCVDWTGQDIPLRKTSKTSPPGFDQLQLRFATTAYHMFKMLARSTPGNQSDAEYYEVLQLGEANLGVSAIGDPVNYRNVYPLLEKEKYYSLGGGGSELKTLAVKSDDRLYIYILNMGPVNLKNIGFDISALQTAYLSAVVRETSLAKRDMPVTQMTLNNYQITVDISPESLTQITFLKEDLAQIEELKIEEITSTPGTSFNLSLFQTTRLKAYGKYKSEWIDLTDLNILWQVSENSGLKIYQGGLLQRLKTSDVQPDVIVKTVNGISKQKTL